MSSVVEFKQNTKSNKTKMRKKPTVTELPGYKKHMEDQQRKNITYQEIATTISDEGEILSQNFKTISKSKEDDFIKLYLSDIGYFHKLQPNQQELLYYFLQRMSYDNLIIINKAVKKMIAEECGKSLGTVDNALTSYVENGILLRKDRGVYTANPYLFGKGRFEDIEKIRMELVYTSDGIKLRSHIEKRDEE